MSSSKYIALTLGPIIKTLDMARKTRELWAASYMFSYLMKEIIKQLVNDNSVGVGDILLPYYSERLAEPQNGTGLFPDRLILRGNIDPEHLFSIADDQVRLFAGNIAIHIGKDASQVYEFLKSYLKYYIVEAEFSEEDLQRDSAVTLMNNYLANAELRENFTPVEEFNYLAHFFSKINIDHEGQHSFLLRDGFGKNGRSFPSIAEIATSDLKASLGNNKYNELLKASREDDDSLILRLKEELKIAKLSFKSSNKYIAILQADGDGLGDYMNKLGNNPSEVRDFSKQLSAFAKESSGIISEFGGTPIYIGGDDILAFLPLCNDHKTIFSLIRDLDDCFKTRLKAGTNLPGFNPTLSYGISITYYKYPMAEALESARNLLFQKAKNVPGKNSIAINLLKHSGQVYHAVIPKSGGVYPEFINIIEKRITNESFLSGIIYTLNNLEYLVRLSYENKRLEYFFQNQFNERIHLQHNDFLNEIRNFVKKVYAENIIQDKKEFMNSALRLVKFLNEKDNEQG